MVGIDIKKKRATRLKMIWKKMPLILIRILRITLRNHKKNLVKALAPKRNVIHGLRNPLMINWRLLRTKSKKQVSSP